MNQPGKPGSGAKPKPGRLLDVADDVSIPILTERVTVAVPTRSPSAPTFTLDTDLPAFAAQAIAPLDKPVAPAGPERRPTPSAAPATAAATPPPATASTAPAAGAPSAAPSASLAPSASPPPPPAAAARAPQPHAAPFERAEPPAALAPAPWGRIEIELREAILVDLAERLPQEVEAIVRGHMSAAIDALVDRLAAETRIAVAGSLRDIVDHAVKAELERLRANKR